MVPFTAQAGQSGAHFRLQNVLLQPNMHLTCANTSPAAHLLTSNPESEPNSVTFLAQNGFHLRLRLASLEPILGTNMLPPGGD